MKDSRSTLLAAAAEEFAKHGRKGARVQSIVKRAGVNERMIYHHFGSKDGLYAAVLDAQMAGLAEAWRPILAHAADLDPYSGMRTVLAGLYDILFARPLFTALYVHEALTGWQTLPLLTIDMLPAPLRDMYERGQHEGVFRSDCPFEVAYGTAVCTLFTLPMLAPRFTRILDEHQGPALFSAQLRDQVVGQLLDGMTGPVQHPEHRGAGRRA